MDDFKQLNGRIDTLVESINKTNETMKASSARQDEKIALLGGCIGKLERSIGELDRCINKLSDCVATANKSMRDLLA